MDEWMTVREAASHLGISESYIRSHIKKGDLNSYMYGYPIRLTASEVDVFLLPFKLD
jgi:excisionase family DNA binding protein